MATETIDRKRIDAAVRRLAVLPERRAEVGRAVTGLMYVIERAALKLDAASQPVPPEPEPQPIPEPVPELEPEPEPEPEVDEALLVAAKELRETQYFIDDFKDAWTGLSAPAREALGRRLRTAGMAEAEVDAMIALLGRVAEAMALSADALEQPEPVTQPVPAPTPEAAAAPVSVAAPVPPPTPEDPSLVIAQHVARMYTRLTGKKPPKPKPDDDITRGAFYWLLQDVLGAAGIVAATDRYAKIVGRR